MLTVLPDALLDEPPPAVLLLPLLLQPAAARATAASAAAIAGVRFNTFMIFLSFYWPALRPGAHRPTRSGLHGRAIAEGSAGPHRICQHQPTPPRTRGSPEHWVGGG